MRSRHKSQWRHLCDRHGLEKCVNCIPHYGDWSRKPKNSDLSPHRCPFDDHVFLSKRLPKWEVYAELKVRA